MFSVRTSCLWADPGWTAYGAEVQENPLIEEHLACLSTPSRTFLCLQLQLLA